MQILTVTLKSFVVFSKSLFTFQFSHIIKMEIFFFFLLNTFILQTWNQPFGDKILILALL